MLDKLINLRPLFYLSLGFSANCAQRFDIQCIERADAEGAREAMRQHMDFIAEDIEAAESETPSPSR